jgi:hypothetical protein
MMTGRWVEGELVEGEDEIRHERIPGYLPDRHGEIVGVSGTGCVGMIVFFV